MDYEAVFCDIDGTLLNDKKEVTPAVRKAIQDLSKLSVPFILVSSRLPEGIYPFLDVLEVKEPIISFGGGLILDSKRNPLFKTGFSKEKAALIEETAIENNINASLNYYTTDKWYATNPDHPIQKKEAEIIGIEPDFFHVKDSPLEEDAVITKCMFTGLEEEINELEPLISTAFKDLNVIKSCPTLLEITPKDVKKSQGIKKLCGIYGFDINNCIGIGDNFNDLDMLENIGFSVLMGNAPQELKKKPFNYYAPDNNHDGVAKALRDIFQMPD